MGAIQIFCLLVRKSTHFSACCPMMRPISVYAANWPSLNHWSDVGSWGKISLDAA